MRAALLTLFLVACVLPGGKGDTEYETVTFGSSGWTYESGNSTFAGLGAYPEGSTSSSGSACYSDMAVDVVDSYELDRLTATGDNPEPHHVGIVGPDGASATFNPAPASSGWSGFTNAFGSLSSIDGTWRVLVPATSAEASGCEGLQAVTLSFERVIE
jgi:hypothetical protein